MSFAGIAGRAIYAAHLGSRAIQGFASLWRDAEGGVPYAPYFAR